MIKLAIIGGTGLSSIDVFKIANKEVIATSFGQPSSPVITGSINDIELAFLARHGLNHTIAPHMVNYRANIWALNELGVEHILAVNAVGGISTNMPPGQLVLPDQIIDYTSNRKNTFFEENLTEVTHIDFSYPYSESLRKKILQASKEENISLIDGATYGATQGPRLETAAEIRRMARDGCDIVGMTGMPEAALARELDIEYASISLIANWGAGISNEPITMKDIESCIVSGMSDTKKIITRLITILSDN